MIRLLTAYYDYMEEIYFFPAAQFAYKKRLGCTDALLPYLITFRSP